MINKHTKTNTCNYTSKHTKKIFNKKKHGGGTILSSVGNFIYTPDAGKKYNTDYSMFLKTSSRFKNLNISSKLKYGINYNNKDNIQIYYNYNTHNKNAKTILINI